MLLPKKWDAKSAPEANEYLQVQQRWCENAHTHAAIESSIEFTLAALSTNAVPDARDPQLTIQWWPVSLPRTSDPSLIETRRVFLRSRAYDFGIELFLREFAKRGSIEPVKAPLIKQLLSGQSYFGFNQMLAFSQMNEVLHDDYVQLRNNKKTHLGEIAKLFGIHGENRHLQFRLSKLVRFASVGFLVSAPDDRGHETMIELGPAGRAFFTRVYVPIINHMPLFDGK